MWKKPCTRLWSVDGLYSKNDHYYIGDEMSVELVMPKLGLNMQEGLLVEWLKKEGDLIKKGDALFIVETEKVVNEYEAQTDGVLIQILVAAGEVVPVRTVVGIVAETGEEGVLHVSRKSVPKVLIPLTPTEEAVMPASAGMESGKILASPIARHFAAEQSINLADVHGSGPGGRINHEDVKRFIALRQAEPISAAGTVLASPAAKRLAREAGIILTSIRGSGTGGRISQDDVEAVINSGKAPSITSTVPDRKRIPVEGVRGVIFERMYASIQATAQITMHSEVDATSLVVFRNQLKQESEQTGKVIPSYNAILISLLSKALRQFPYMNARLEEGAIQLLDEVHIGLAVDTEAGLMVIVVRDVDQKTIEQVNQDILDMSGRAIKRRSHPDDLVGSTFTVTNLGGLGIDGFTPILNTPEIGILGVGRILEKLVLKDGKVAQRHMFTLSLTFDHRIVDGAPAARFLQGLAGLISKIE
jgi:pyruvate dehydrogenase E2 component (dihydrolipoamide acetyltransferase)